MHTTSLLLIHRNKTKILHEFKNAQTKKSEKAKYMMIFPVCKVYFVYASVGIFVQYKTEFVKAECFSLPKSGEVIIILTHLYKSEFVKIRNRMYFSVSK